MAGRTTAANAAALASQPTAARMAVAATPPDRLECDAGQVWKHALPYGLLHGSEGGGSPHGRGPPVRAGSWPAAPGRRRRRRRRLRLGPLLRGRAAQRYGRAVLVRRRVQRVVAGRLMAGAKGAHRRLALRALGLRPRAAGGGPAGGRG